MASAAVEISLATPVDPALDNLQDLLRRKADIKNHKNKFHLTEADASLLLTNANEYTFTDGQVILEEGQENSSVYRIKYGRVALSKNGQKFCEMSQVCSSFTLLIISCNANINQGLVLRRNTSAGQQER